jgi:DNA-binding NarL/FixJ family response regulator
MYPNHRASVSIAIVDDHAGVAGFMADSLKQSFSVVGSATTGSEALDLVGAQRPDVTLLDIQLGQENGLALVKPLTRLKTGVLLFTAHELPSFRPLAMKSGAMGLISLGDTVGRFVEAIHAVAAGERWLPEPGAPTPGEVLLGARRLEIVRFLRDGFGTKQIASRLGLSIGTIEFHIRSLKALLGGAQTHAEVVAEAIRRGYIPPPGLEDENALMTPRPN